MNTENEKNLRILKNVAIFFTAAFCLFAFPGVRTLFVEAFKPILTGFLIAYVVNIICDALEKLLLKWKVKVPRAAVVTLSIVLVIAAFVLILLLIVPQFVSAIRTFFARLPGAVEDLLALPAAQQLLGPDTTSQVEKIDWNSILRQLADILYTGMGSAGSKISSAASALTSGFLGIVFSLYFLAGKDSILNGIRRLAKHMLPAERYASAGRFLSRLDTCSRKYVAGQCIEAVILGTLCALGMVLFRMPYASMVGALVGITALIPLVGALIGGLIGAFMVLTVSPTQAVIFVVFFIVLQQLEGNLIYPRVVGSSVGLPGVLILIAVTIGGTLFGFLGMIVFVPVVAAVYTLAKEQLAE